MRIVLYAAVWLTVTLTAGPASRPIENPPAPSEPDLARRRPWKVVGIESPDCILVSREGAEVRIRLAAIQMPEVCVPSALAARTFLRNLLLGEKAWLVPASASRGPAEAPSYVYRWPDRLFVNLELVRQGYVDFRADIEADPNTVRSFRYWRNRARQAGKGIWHRPSAATQLGPASQPTTPTRKSPTAIVYVTRRGRKYHLESCTYLRKSSKAISLIEARKRYQPCKVCKPPK